MTANRDSKLVIRKYAEHSGISYIEAARLLTNCDSVSLRMDNGKRYAATCFKPWTGTDTYGNKPGDRYVLFTSNDPEFQTCGIHFYRLAAPISLEAVPQQFLNKVLEHARSSWGFGDSDVKKGKDEDAIMTFILWAIQNKLQTSLTTQAGV